MPGSQAFCKVMGTYNAASNSYSVSSYFVSLWTVGMIPGQLIGFLASSIISDQFGRRANLQVCLIILCLGAVSEVCAYDWKIWLVSKFVMSIANGLGQGGVATFASEISPREFRGGAIIAYMTFNNVGNLLSTIILYVCRNAYPDPSNALQYKITLYIMVGLPVVIFILTLLMIPESPTWLVMNQKMSRAFNSLERIYPYMSQEEIEIEMAKVQLTVEKEREYAALNKEVRWIEIFKGNDLRRTIIATIPMCSYNLTGNILLLLSSYFFAVTGETETAFQSTLIVQCPAIFFNLFAMVMVEDKRIGRWRSLLAGLAIMTVGMILIGIIGSVYGAQPGTSTSGGALLIVGFIISSLGCQIGPQAVGYLYSTESGSSRLRAKTISFSQGVGGLLGNLAGIYAPYMISPTQYVKWGCKTGYFFVPDYTGRSYAQIDELFARRVAARKFASTECTGHFGNETDIQMGA